MTDGIKIEKGIPLPARRKGLLAGLNVDDSVFFSDIPRAKLQSLAYQHGKNHDQKFTVRRWTQDGVIGLRVWRIA